MTLDNSADSGERFRSLLQRALRGDHDSAWQLLERYGDQLLHLLLVKRREQPDLPGDAPRLVAQIWEFLRPNDAPLHSASKSAMDELPLEIPSATGAHSKPYQADVSTVGLGSPTFPTLNTSSAHENQPSLEAQVESARRRWKHLIVTPTIHAQILRQRLHGATIAEIAGELGLAEPVVKHVLETQARHEGPPR